MLEVTHKADDNKTENCLRQSRYLRQLRYLRQSDILEAEIWHRHSLDQPDYENLIRLT